MKYTKIFMKKQGGLICSISKKMLPPEVQYYKHNLLKIK